MKNKQLHLQYNNTDPLAVSGTSFVNPMLWLATYTSILFLSQTWEETRLSGVHPLVFFYLLQRKVGCGIESGSEAVREELWETRKALGFISAFSRMTSSCFWMPGDKIGTSHTLGMCPFCVFRFEKDSKLSILSCNLFCSLGWPWTGGFLLSSLTSECPDLDTSENNFCLLNIIP